MELGFNPYLCESKAFWIREVKNANHFIYEAEEEMGSLLSFQTLCWDVHVWSLLLYKISASTNLFYLPSYNLWKRRQVQSSNCSVQKHNASWHQKLNWNPRFPDQWSRTPSIRPPTAVFRKNPGSPLLWEPTAGKPLLGRPAQGENPSLSSFSLFSPHHSMCLFSQAQHLLCGAVNKYNTSDKELQIFMVVITSHPKKGGMDQIIRENQPSMRYVF